MNHQQDPVITIDGASGTGKGTVSQLLATRLGWRFLDSGALYRVLALAAIRHGVDLELVALAVNRYGKHENEAEDAKVLEVLNVLAEHLDVQFIAQENAFPHIILEGEEVTEAIRTEEIGRHASIIAVLPFVRAALLSRQRAFREPPGLVADGRDMGTVVFPDAKLKVFLMASPEERARRRFNQLKLQGNNVNLSDLIAELRERDKRDQERTVAPLKPAEDAILIDTDYLSADQVVERIISEIHGKKTFPAISFPPMMELAEVLG